MDPFYSPGSEKIHGLRVVMHLDRGAGTRKVAEWRGGEIVSVLPYSRATESIGEAWALEMMEAVLVRRRLSPQGLGLDIMRPVVQVDNGSVQVTSRPGRTEFRVALPIAATPSTHAPGLPTEASHVAG